MLINRSLKKTGQQQPSGLNHFTKTQQLHFAQYAYFRKTSANIGKFEQ